MQRGAVMVESSIVLATIALLAIAAVGALGYAVADSNCSAAYSLGRLEKIEAKFDRNLRKCCYRLEGDLQWQCPGGSGF